MKLKEFPNCVLEPLVKDNAYYYVVDDKGFYVFTNIEDMKQQFGDSEVDEVKTTKCCTNIYVK